MVAHHFFEELRRALLSLSEIPDLPREAILRLIQRGAIRELLTNPTAESVALLEEACLSAPLPQVRDEAFDALVQLSRQNHPQAVLSLYRLAVENEHAAAIAFLKSDLLPCPSAELQAVFSFLHLTDHDYAQSDNQLQHLATYFFHHAHPSTRLKICQITTSPLKRHISTLLDILLLDEPEKTSRLLSVYPQTSPTEKTVILERLASLAQSNHAAARDALCRLVILYDDPAALEICFKHHYTPSTPSEKALYLFLTSQWEEYESFDFAHQWLLEAYTSASPSLRQKILAHARQNGQVDWLSQISSSRPTVILWELSPADWEKIFATVLTNPSDVQWLQLLTYAPLYWSAQLLSRLAKTSHGLVDESELNELVHLSEACTSHSLPIFNQSILHSPAGSAACMAISPFGMEVALGGLDSTIQFLDLTSLEWQKPIISPVSPTRYIGYDPQAGYLVCAGGDHRLRIFRRHDHALLKTLEGHKGQIRSIVFQSDGRLFYSAGFDGMIQSWHFPSGLVARPPVQTSYEILSLSLSPDNKTLIFTSADRTCHILPIQAQQPVQSISELDGIPLALAMNRRQKLAIATRNATIQQFSLSSLKSLVPPSFTTESPITHLVFHPDLPLLFGMGLDGKLYVWHEDDSGHLLSIEAHQQAGCGLGLTPDGDKLVSCSSDGRVIILDLQSFLLFFQPLHNDPHRWIEKIDLWLKIENQPSTRLWLEFARGLLQWRARYDIQIEEAEALQIGEYDILL